ncbi:MAG: hypothetical protein F6J94_26530 [Moorea sp. SIO1F2]|uniref:hypothetical protein n=1 Tax=Moorena sp. SIO1F2 TaxID=2607819 RepID=UPI0013BA245D|nr:hypothetical protein [Moorena sp. SIO1F2]NET85333.1 hypothetical protein [Moorena sp. SIO1F2]
MVVGLKGSEASLNLYSICHSYQIHSIFLSRLDAVAKYNKPTPVNCSLLPAPCSLFPLTHRRK